MGLIVFLNPFCHMEQYRSGEGHSLGNRTWRSQVRLGAAPEGPVTRNLCLPTQRAFSMSIHKPVRSRIYRRGVCTGGINGKPNFGRG